MKKLITLLVLTALLAPACKQTAKEIETIDNNIVLDPLPSWNEGPTKAAIIEFVNEVTKEDGPNYVHPNERTATFDNDGTLGCEQPVAQLEFVTYQIKRMASDHPEWKGLQPYKSILEGDKNFLAMTY
jgi:hypothetical protein